MAQGGVLLDKKKYECPVCFDLPKDPVTIPCGHSYCMNCIKNHWDGEKEKWIYSCPYCREIFTLKPVLVKNIMLADLVEELKKTGLQDAPADHCYAGPEDVACDFCTGRKLKALKSCLMCTASYCKKHLQPHYESPSFKKHKLVEPSKNLQENISPHHDGLMKMFRRTDQWQISDFRLEHENKEPQTRAEFLTYSREITLDPNTANPRLLLSDGNRKISLMNQHQSYTYHQDRFALWEQVLSRESLTGRCYWEVELRGRGVGIAVAYKNIRRAGGTFEDGFGRNDKSWLLISDTRSYNFWFNNSHTPVSGPLSSRVGVYLDHSAGILSFYSVSKIMTLLHRVQTTFTQPLHAGLWLYYHGDTAEFI